MNNINSVSGLLRKLTKYQSKLSGSASEKAGIYKAKIAYYMNTMSNMGVNMKQFGGDRASLEALTGQVNEMVTASEERVRATGDRLREITRRVQELVALKNEQTARANALQGELTALQAERAELNAKAEQLRGATEQLRGLLNGKVMRKDGRPETYDSTDKDINALLEYVTRYVEDRDAYITAVKNGRDKTKKADLESLNNELQEQNASLTAELDANRRELVTIRTALDEANETIARLNAEIAQLTAERNGLADERDAVTANLADRNTQVGVLTGEVARITGERDAVTGELTERDTAEGALTDALARLRTTLATENASAGLTQLEEILNDALGRGGEPAGAGAGELAPATTRASMAISTEDVAARAAFPPASPGRGINPLLNPTRRTDGPDVSMSGRPTATVRRSPGATVRRSPGATVRRSP